MWSVLGGRKRGPRPYPGLITPGEQRVLELLRLGMTNAQIAERLGISPDGVKYHVSNMLSKLGFDRREQLAAWDASDPPKTRPAVELPGWRNMFGERTASAVVLAVVASAVLALLVWARPRDDGEDMAVPATLTWTGEPMTVAGPSGSGWVIHDVRWEGGNVAVYYYPTEPNGQAALAIRVGTTMIGTSGAIELLDAAPNGLSLAKVRLSRRSGSTSVTFSPGPLQVHLREPFTVILRPGAGDYVGTVDIDGDIWRVRGLNRNGDEFEIRFESGPIPQPLNPVGPTTDVELRDSSGRRYTFRTASFFGEGPTALTFDGPVPARAGVLTLWVSGPAKSEPIPDLLIPLSAVAGTPP